MLPPWLSLQDRREKAGEARPSGCQQREATSGVQRGGTEWLWGAINQGVGPGYDETSACHCLGSKLSLQQIKKKMPSQISIGVTNGYSRNAPRHKIERESILSGGICPSKDFKSGLWKKYGLSHLGHS